LSYNEGKCEPNRKTNWLRTKTREAMKSFYPPKKLRTDESILKEIKKLDNLEVRTDEMWNRRCELVKLLKTPHWLR
jgi:hypothetical protein